MEEFENCFFRVYEYTFTYNNESYIADYCYSGKLGSYCEKDDITYHNVQYISTIVGCDDNLYKTNDNNNKIFNLLISFLLVFLLIFHLYKIFSLFIRGVK